MVLGESERSEDQNPLGFCVRRRCPQVLLNIGVHDMCESNIYISCGIQIGKEEVAKTRNIGCT